MILVQVTRNSCTNLLKGGKFQGPSVSRVLMCGCFLRSASAEQTDPIQTRGQELAAQREYRGGINRERRIT
jgi:hypothetical protein